MNSLAHEVSTRNWSTISIEDAVLLRPVHQEEPKEGESHDDGLQGHEETGEEEGVSHVDVVVAQLKLDALVQDVVLLLGLGQFAA